ncbi:hypothetical protein VNO80_01932 [Phaseolus coccineus]|uniref:Uncharacterized protein n=1 Tax=Phaseolus coccineus TaxID=3886 RepID=A0AAN9RTC1_PHACN
MQRVLESLPSERESSFPQVARFVGLAFSCSGCKMPLQTVDFLLADGLLNAVKCQLICFGFWSLSNISVVFQAMVFEFEV